MAKWTWAKLKIEYVTCETSYRNLAEKHGVSFQTLKHRALKEGWFRERKKYQDNVAKKTLQKVADKKSAVQARQIAKLQSASGNLVNLVDKLCSDTEWVMKSVRKSTTRMNNADGSSTTECTLHAHDLGICNTKALRDLSASLKDLTGVIRNVYDLPYITEKTATDISLQRLELDKQKVIAEETDVETGVIILPEILDLVEPPE